MKVKAIAKLFTFDFLHLLLQSFHNALKRTFIKDAAGKLRCDQLLRILKEFTDYMRNRWIQREIRGGAACELREINRLLRQAEELGLEVTLHNDGIFKV